MRLASDTLAYKKKAQRHARVTSWARWKAHPVLAGRAEFGMPQRCAHYLSVLIGLLCASSCFGYVVLWEVPHIAVHVGKGRGGGSSEQCAPSETTLRSSHQATPGLILVVVVVGVVGAGL